MPTDRTLEDARWLRRTRPGTLADARLDYARNRAEAEAQAREDAEAAAIAAERLSA